MKKIRSVYTTIQTLFVHNNKIQQRQQQRNFRSRAEYDEWTRRMKESRLIINPKHRSDDKQQRSKSVPTFKLVNAKTAAPFLYSVSPLSDRLLLYSYMGHERSEYSRDDDNGIGGSQEDIQQNNNGTRIKSPSASLLECIYPLSEDRYNHHHSSKERVNECENSFLHEKDLSDLEILRASVSDFGTFSTFRLAKFYSDVDALTADVAYRHISDDDDVSEKDVKNSTDAVAFVTAGHYFSRNNHKTDITKDMILRCYPTSTGRSSMEIRTDAIQLDENGNELLVNVCFTSMVAVDKETLRPVKDEHLIPKLVPDDDNFFCDSSANLQIRSEMAAQHNKIRKERFAKSMQLRHGPNSSPPTQSEMADVHSLHQHVITDSHNDNKQSTPLPHMHQYTYRSSFIIYPEKRNVHGKLFGGFVMEQGHTLAQYAADFYLYHCSPDKNYIHTTKHETDFDKSSSSTGKNKKNYKCRAIPLGLDEATFLQPISIGDHVTFTARVVHSTSKTCRVVVIVEVFNPDSSSFTNHHHHHPRPTNGVTTEALPLRSNRLSFLFAGSHFPEDGIVPDDYREILMHVDAKRRVHVEGPSDEDVINIFGNTTL